MSMILAAVVAAAVTCPKPATPAHHHRKPVVPVATCEAPRPVVISQAEPEPEIPEIPMPVVYYRTQEIQLPCMPVQHWWTGWFDFDQSTYVSSGRDITARLPGGHGFAAPEIDPASGLSACTLLGGVLLVMRGRRK